VIQDIYAAGMGLEAARRSERGRRGGKSFDRVLAQLNGVIRKIRRHLTNSMRIMRRR
jgi:hypothetical protein